MKLLIIVKKVGLVPRINIDSSGSSLSYKCFKSCVFCDIVARRSLANVRYEDEDILVFDNQLDWVPIMLLIIPKCHLTQIEFWRHPDLMLKATTIALSLGEDLAPSGFRVLSNFGKDAEQTQDHAHIHVIGGAYLGLYIDQRILSK